MSTVSNLIEGGADAAVVRVPFVLSGRLVEGDAVHHSSRDLGAAFVTPALDFARLARPRSEPAPAEKLKVAEIIEFLAETGRRMTLDNPYLREAVDRVAPVSTIPHAMLERCFASLAEVFDREALEITVESDVGAEALDGWKPIRGIRGRRSVVRACPPRLVHVMAGNSPIVAALTVAHGALTKGVHLLKMASNDLFTATAILRIMADIDAEHPVVRSFSAVYWRGGDASVENVLYRPQFFDKIVVWGGEKAVRHVQKYIGPGFQMVSWDPKTSISLIGREAFASDAILAGVAARAATDASVMNQDACLASRYQYVEGSIEQVDRYCELLVRELGQERYYASACGLPTPAAIREEVDGLRHLEPDFRVWGDYSGAGLVIRSDEPLDFYPDCRTVNVVPVASLQDAVRFANVGTQTVGIYPFERKAELRDRLADFGVQYVACLGDVMDLPPGLPHDGTYELNRLVRWVADEGPATA
jgi:hypothetical protein